MCRLKSEGGRCNGWFKKELSKVKGELTEMTSIRNDIPKEELKQEISKVLENQDLDPKEKKKIERKLERFSNMESDFSKKDIIEIDTEKKYTPAEFKALKKRVKPAIEAYRDYDGEKYEKAISCFGKVFIDTHMTTLQKDGSSGDEVVSEMKKVLNDMGIKTGNPNKIKLQGKAEYKDKYNRFMDAIPTSIFDKERDDSRTVKFTVTKSYRREAMNQESKRVYEPSRNVVESFPIDEKETAEAYIEKRKQETKYDLARFGNHPALKHLGYQKNEFKMVTNTETNSIDVIHERYSYHVSKNRPAPLKNVTETDWDAHDTILGSYIVWRTLEPDVKKEVKELRENKNIIKLSQYSTENTFYHEVTHSLENMSDEVMKSQGAIFNSRVDKLEDKRAYSAYGYASGEKFHHGAFSELYMSKSYKRVLADGTTEPYGYELYSMSNGAMFSGEGSKFEEKNVANAFFGLMALQD